MRVFLTFLVLLFWISSWFPIAPGRGAIFLTVFCLLGLLAAHFAPKAGREGLGLSKRFVFLGLAVLIIGALLALMTWAEGTSANGAIMLFYVLGFVGYLLLLRAVVAPRHTYRAYRSAGGLLLVVIALWSWASAIGMYAHRGAAGDFDDACILVSNPAEYDTELVSLWEMRLPEIASQRTSPGGSYIWEYHAILVAKTDGQTEHYNWSKKWIRFDQLGAKRNPYLPTTCP